MALQDVSLVLAIGQICLYSLAFLTLAMECQQACSVKYEINLFPPQGMRITGVAIISEQSVAVALNNNTIKIVTFNGNLNQDVHNTCPLREIYINDKHLQLSKIPPEQLPDTVIILTGTSQYYVYVLTQSKHLYLYTYNASFQTPKKRYIANGVTKISTPHSGATNIVFITSNNKIWLTNPTKDPMTSEVPTAPFEFEYFGSQQSMTLVDNILYLSSFENDLIFFRKHVLWKTATPQINNSQIQSANTTTHPPLYRTLTQYTKFHPRPATTTASSPPPGAQETQDDSSTDDDKVVYVPLSEFHT